MTGYSFGTAGSAIGRCGKQPKDYLIDEKNACVRGFKKSFHFIKIINREMIVNKCLH